MQQWWQLENTCFGNIWPVLKKVTDDIWYSNQIIHLKIAHKNIDPQNSVKFGQSNMLLKSMLCEECMPRTKRSCTRYTRKIIRGKIIHTVIFTLQPDSFNSGQTPMSFGQMVYTMTWICRNTETPCNWIVIIRCSIFASSLTL
ncbi:unnamed protein product [Ixodes pacificus]